MFPLKNISHETLLYLKKMSFWPHSISVPLWVVSFGVPILVAPPWLSIEGVLH